MLQTLFHVPSQFHGLPVFGFGLLLAAWMVFSAIVLARMVRRQGWNADTLGYLPLLAIVAAVILWVLPALTDAKGLPIRGYGVMVLLAVLSGLGLLLWRARRAGVDPEMILTLAFWMILPGILGARVVYVVQKWPEQFWPIYLDEKHGGLGPLVFAVVNMAAGGLVVYGAFLGGLVGLYLFWRKYCIPLLPVADLFAPSLILGLALGRIGCLMNGCCFGGPCDLPWKITFPWDSPVHAHQVTVENAPLFGLSLKDGKDGPVIAEIEPGSPGEKGGLRAGQPVYEINGVPVESAKHAETVMLAADKLNLIIRTAKAEPMTWTIDDPPAADSQHKGGLTLFGLDLGPGENGLPVITRVASQSAEAAAGLRPGQHVVSVNGRLVRSMEALSSLMDRHRHELWADVKTSNIAPAVELAISRPLPRSLPVHPAQLYAAISAMLLCFVLLAFDRVARREGMVFALLITLYPIARFLEEMIRTDEKGLLGTNLHISQFISLGLLVFALGLWVYIRKQPEGRRFLPRNRKLPQQE
jgi:phosphatidylglycerol:prolipoprotein diacylglycerol transferase